MTFNGAHLPLPILPTETRAVPSAPESMTFNRAVLHPPKSFPLIRVHTHAARPPTNCKLAASTSYLRESFKSVGAALSQIAATRSEEPRHP